MLFLLVVVVGGLGMSRRRLSLPLAVALGALAAYTLWSFLSITWANAPGAALEGSNRTLLYLLVAMVFALLPWTVGSLRTALQAYVLAMGVLALVTILRVKGAEDPLEYFVNARLSAPMGYQNAAPAIWTMCALPALVFASRRDTLIALRPVFLGLATLFFTLGLTSQSRTWLAMLPVLAVMALVLTPTRIRFVLAALPVALATFLARAPLLDVYDSGGISFGDLRTEGEIARVLQSAFADAAGAMLLASLAVAALGVAWVLIDRRVEVSERRHAQLARAGRYAAAAAAALVLLGAFVASDGDPVEKIDNAVEEFKAGADPGEGGGSRFSSLGSSRYDFWRVSWDLFTEHPVTGLGQDNFASEYLPRSRSDETPRWTHSLELRLLTHTGLVGFLLFAAFAAALTAATWRVRRMLDESGRAVLVAAAMPAAAWLLAGSVDWFWEFPALTAPAVAFAVAGARVGDVETPAAVEPRWATAAGIAAVLAAVVVLGAPWLAARHTAEGIQALPDVAAARDHLERARDLDPFATRPSMVLGLISARLGDEVTAAAHFRETLDRQADNWEAELRLGTVLTASRKDEAMRHLRHARELNPGSSVVQDAVEGLAEGEPLSMDEINKRLEEAERRLTAR